MDEKYKVIGIRRFDYKSKKSGNSYEACEVYATYERSGVDGLACAPFFARSDRVSKDVSPGMTVQVFYNRFGSVDAIIKA